MIYVPETYEERADFAEHQVDVLEAIIVSALQQAKVDKDKSLSELREQWKNYVQGTRY